MIKFFKSLFAACIEDRITTEAAALAYFLFLSLFPLLMVMLSVLSFLPVAQVEQFLLQNIRQALPGAGAEVIEGYILSFAGSSRTGILSLSILGVIWTASTGFKALIEGVNLVYRLNDRRAFWKTRLIAVFLLFLFILLVFGSSMLIVLGDFILDWARRAVDMIEIWPGVFQFFQWLVILFSFVLGFSLVYYLSPAVKVKYRFLSPGIAVSVSLFVASCYLLKQYVRYFSTFSITYGSLGAIIILMLWFYATGFILLLGAEVDHLLFGKRSHGAGKRDL